MSSRCPKPPTRIELVIITYIVFVLLPGIAAIAAIIHSIDTHVVLGRDVAIAGISTTIAIAGHMISKRKFRKLERTE